MYFPSTTANLKLTCYPVSVVDDKCADTKAKYSSKQISDETKIEQACRRLLFMDLISVYMKPL